VRGEKEGGVDSFSGEISKGITNSSISGTKGSGSTEQLVRGGGQGRGKKKNGVPCVEITSPSVRKIERHRRVHPLEIKASRKNPLPDFHLSQKK